MKCRCCGEEFAPRTVTQVYCSKRCREAGCRRGLTRFVPLTFACAKCGKTVVTEPSRRDKRSRFCSARCEKKYWRHPPHEHESCRQNFRSAAEYASYERRTNEV